MYGEDTTWETHSTISCVSHVLYLMWNCKMIHDDIIEELNCVLAFMRNNITLKVKLGT